MSPHHTAARSALIRRGLDPDTRESLRALHTASLRLLTPGSNPRAIEAEIVEAGKALLHRAAATAAIN